MLRFTSRHLHGSPARIEFRLCPVAVLHVREKLKLSRHYISAVAKFEL